MFLIVIVLLIGLVSQSNGVQIDSFIWFAFGVISFLRIVALVVELVKKETKEKK